MSDQTTTAPPPVEQAREQAQQIAGQAKEQAAEQARNLADQARSQVDDRSTQAGQKVTEHARSIRSVADHLRSQGKESEARYAEQAAEKIERAGSWLTESDANKILHEVEDFGRQRPWAVIGAGIALGIAASRMLKASSTQRYAGGGSTAPTTQHSLPRGTGLQQDTAPPRTGEGTWMGPGNGTA